MITTLAALLATVGSVNVAPLPSGFTTVNPVSEDKLTIYNQASAKQPINRADRVFIVRFDAPSAVQYHQNVVTSGKHQLSALASAGKQMTLHRNDDVNQYVTQLEQEQKHLIDEMQRQAGQFKVLSDYQYAFNGIAISATAQQAERLRAMAGISHVEADAVRKLNTDTGPLLIGADNVWNGTASSLDATQGEGITIAVLDTGINTDHPSFAAVGEDGYSHLNPLGAGNYLGDCNLGFPALCNDKLIGVYSYSAITDVYTDNEIFQSPPPANGEDYNGHGSHVAAIAAGNVLNNVAEVLPDSGEVQSDGIESGFIYERISGVAPHANVISFQVCLPGEDDDTYNGCYDSVIARAIEDAIASGVVDVINFSISGGGDPWTGAVNEAWLAAHNAGIFTTHSASNSGPDDYTTEKQSPWMTVVGATTHGRLVDYEKQIEDFSGGTFTPAPIRGASNTGSVRAPVVYAGNVTNPNDPGNDSAQCLEAFPAGTFDGQIVICDRGDIARIQKAKNIAAGGAGGFILANVDGGATNLANDTYVIPGIHIDAADAFELRNWLSQGGEHIATITAANGGISVDPDAADIVADFSSRGPNSLVSTLTPHLTAPGVDIFSAYSDEHIGHDITGPAPADFAYLSGTSMASPHVAGAAALIKAIHPGWSPDEIRSAMMLTAQTSIQAGNSGRAATWFDMGAGRVQVDAAIATSLIMNETTARYIAANPEQGGEPRSLNIPAIIDSECFTQCVWQRTVTATRDGNWTAQAVSEDPGFGVSVSPTSFTLSTGESQTVTVTMDTQALGNNQRGSGQITLTDDTNSVLHIPVVAFASNGTVPDAIDIEAHRNFDSLLIENIYTADISELTVSSFGFVKADRTAGILAPDSDNSELLDDIDDGLFIVPLTVAADAVRLVAEITDSSANDLDLYLLFDENENGTPEASEIVFESTSFSVSEYISVNNPKPGNYWVIVQNWAGSGDAADDFTLYTAVLDSSLKSNLTVTGPQSVAAEEEFDLQISWALPDAQNDDRYYGAFALGSDAQETDDIGFTAVDLIRARDDVYLSSAGPARVSPGDKIPFTVNVITNDTPQDREYLIDVILPDTLQLDIASVTGAADVTQNQISWEVTQTAVETPENAVAMTNTAADLQCQEEAENVQGLSDWTPSAPDNARYKTYALNQRYFGQAFSHMTVTQNGLVNFDAVLDKQQLETARTIGQINSAYQVSPFFHALDQSKDIATRVMTSPHGRTIVQWADMQSDHQVILSFAPEDDLQRPKMVLAYPSLTEVASASLINNKKILWSSEVHSRLNSTDAVCFYPLSTTVQVVAQLQFEATVRESAQPGPFDIQLLSRVVNVAGAQQEKASLFTGVQVDAAPQVSINGAETISITGGQSTQLSAVASDANGDELQFQWQTVANVGASLLNAQTDTVTLTAPAVSEATDITVQVIVTDSFGNQASDSITVSVVPAPARAQSDGSSGGGALHWWGLILLMPVALRRMQNRGLRLTVIARNNK